MPPPWSLWNERRCCVLTCGCRAEYERARTGASYCDYHKPAFIEESDRVKIAEPTLVGYDWHDGQRKARP